MAGIGSQGCLTDGKTNGLLSFWRVLDRFWKNAKRKFLRMSEFFVLDVFDGCLLFHYHRRKVKSHAVLYYAVCSLFEF